MDFIVEYTVAEGKEEEAAEVRRRFFAELVEQADPEILYRSFRRPDGRRFVHIAWFADAAAQQRFTSLPGFAAFGQGLREVSEDGPHAEELEQLHTSVP